MIVDAPPTFGIVLTDGRNNYGGLTDSAGLWLTVLETAEETMVRRRAIQKEIAGEMISFEIYGLNGLLDLAKSTNCVGIAYGKNLSKRMWVQ